MGALKNYFPFNFLLLCKVLLVLMVFPILCTIHASAKKNLPPIKDGKSTAFFFFKDAKYTVNLPQAMHGCLAGYFVQP